MHATADTTSVIFGNRAGRRVMRGVRRLSLTENNGVGLSMKQLTVPIFIVLTVCAIGLSPLSINTSSAQTVGRNPLPASGDDPNQEGSVGRKLLPTGQPSSSPTTSVTPSPTPPTDNSNIKNRLSLLNSEMIKPEPPTNPTRTTQASVEPAATPLPTDPQVEATYNEALKEYYSALRLKNQAAGNIYGYNNWALEDRKKLFEWQHFSGKIIFIVVIFLVLMGVVFSGIQFYIAMKQLTRKRRASKTADVQESEVLPTTLKASLSGIEVSSSILGIIILMISFLFFYLYLRYVYPISFV